MVCMERRVLVDTNLMESTTSCRVGREGESRGSVVDASDLSGRQDPAASAEYIHGPQQGSDIERSNLRGKLRLTLNSAP